MQDAWAKEIGERIQDARNAAGLTQPELADLLVVHLRTVGNYEKGEHLPFKDLPKIAEILDTDIRWLLHGAVYHDPLQSIDQRLKRIEDQLRGAIHGQEQAAIEAETEERARQSEQTASGSSVETPGQQGRAR